MTTPPGEREGGAAPLDSLLASELGLPWHASILPFGLSALLAAAWLLLPGSLTQGWGVSWPALQRGNLLVLLLHMLVHGSAAHLLLNIAALAVIGPRLMARFGRGPIAWARFTYVFVGSGMAGGLAFLLLNDAPSSSAIGASGAIFGLLAALARVDPRTGSVVAIRSRRTSTLLRLFVRDHMLIFLLLAACLALTGSAISVAWEAHLGGLLFGLFVTPLFLPSRFDVGDTGRPLQ